MAKFSEVFSTTFKVIAALILISLGAGVIYLIVNHVDESAKIHEDYKQATKEEDARITNADAKHTSMPLSEWNKLVATAIKQHCALEGMHKGDVEKALGKPLETSHNYDNTESWKYVFEDQKKCLKYEGEKCAEHPKNDGTVYLTPAGYVYLGNAGPGCNEGSLLWMVH